MSFVNPGDQQAGAEALPDPCATFDCGEHGSCLAMNMTPTCVCETGYVAIASAEGGGRGTTCVAPNLPIAAEFYSLTLPDPTRFRTDAGAAGDDSGAADSNPSASRSGASCAFVPSAAGALPPWWFGGVCAGVGLACRRRSRRSQRLGSSVTRVS